MKKIILSTVAVLALSSSVMAFDLAGENESIFVRFGINAEGTQNNAKNVVLDSQGNATCGDGLCGKIGEDKDMGYEFTFGIEEKVADGQWGSRKMVTIYDHGDSTIHNGGLVTENKNIGVEGTYEIFYSVNKYIKPYVGAGFGINRSSVDYEARSSEGGAFLPSMTYDREKENFKPTLHSTVGISGDIFKNFGYYVSYKYRLGDTSTTVLPFRQEGTVVNKTIEIDGVSGGQFMVGFSYRF